MNLFDIWEKSKPWLKPGLTVLLGLILLFRPDSITGAIGTVFGFAVALVGCAMLVSFFFGHTRDGLRLAGAIILMVLGFSIIQRPLALTSQIGRFIGILLMLQSVRQLTGEVTVRSKSMSVVSGIVGLVLMLVPVSSSRLLISGCGLVVLLVGLGLMLDKWKSDKHPPKDDIIDAQ